MEQNKKTVGVLEIADLWQVTELPQGLEKAYVLCEGNEQLSIQDAQGMCASGIAYEFITCASRDERLVCLGGILESSEACVVLGNGLPVPSRYADKTRIIQTRKPAARKPKPRSRPKAPATKAGEMQKQQGYDAAPDMPRPKDADCVPETASVPEFAEPDDAALFALIGVRSEDIGFSHPTDVLMARILSLAAEVETPEELISSIRNGIRNSGKLVRACAGHEHEILALGHDVH